MANDVEVHHPGDGKTYGNGPVIYYGQALTGRPIDNATLMDAPRDQRDQEWIDAVLSCRILPGGVVRTP